MITYLKIIVIVLGLMIAAGVAVIGVKLAEKNDELAALTSAESESSSGIARSEAAAPLAPALGDLGLPAGSRVQRMTTADHRLILVIAVPEGGERIAIVDLRNGRAIADIGIEGAP